MSSFNAWHCYQFVTEYTTENFFQVNYILPKKLATTRCSVQQASSCRTMVLLNWSGIGVPSYFQKALNIFRVHKVSQMIYPFFEPLCTKNKGSGSLTKQTTPNVAKKKSFFFLTLQQRMVLLTATLNQFLVSLPKNCWAAISS